MNNNYSDDINLDIVKRIEKIRDLYKLSKRGFSKELGYKSHSRIIKMLNGKIPISDKFVIAICYRYNINEKWIKTGEGSMYKDTTTDERDYIISLIDKMDYNSKKFMLRLLNVLIKFENIEKKIK